MILFATRTKEQTGSNTRHTRAIQIAVQRSPALSPRSKRHFLASLAISIRMM